MKLFSRNAGSGPPMIILHGLFGISDNWATLGRRFSENFSVYALDLRNHGQSPHSDEWTYDLMARDVIELMDEYGIAESIIIGHSMGGKTAMRLALDHPGRVSKLIVADISPRKSVSDQRDVVNALEATKPEECTSRKEAESRLAQYITNIGTQQFLLKNLYWKDLPGGEKILTWRFNLPVISRLLSNISEATDEPVPCLCDTLFIRGSRSNYITAEDEPEIAHIFPHSKIVTIEGAGHWLHADKPNEFYEAVMNFVS